MDHDNTIPSQLGPASTMPAPLSTAAPLASETDSPGFGGLLVKLFLLTVVVGLALYLAR